MRNVDSKQRHIERMERYLDGQPLSKIANAIGLSVPTIEERVKRVIAQVEEGFRKGKSHGPRLRNGS